MSTSYSNRRKRIFIVEVSQWVLDCLIVAGIFTAVFFGYAGYFWTFCFAFAAVVLLASFRFFDFEAASRPTGASGELNPELPSHEPAHRACVSDSDSSSDSEGGSD